MEMFIQFVEFVGCFAVTVVGVLVLYSLYVFLRVYINEDYNP